MSADELDPSARELVAAARRARTPSDAQRDRSYRMVLVGLSAAAPLGAAKLAAAQLARSAALSWLKWAGPTVFAAAASFGVYVWHEQRPAAQASATQLAARTPDTAQHAATPPVLAPPSLGNAPNSAASPASAIPNPKAQLVVRPQPDQLAEELTLLHRALAEARSGNSAHALELAQQHARRYPHSRLRAERDAIEVRSLCALGRATEARQLASQLRSRAPSSPVSAALAETCAGNN